jgi:hypothetical protein
MKKLKMVGQVLTKAEQKSIIGGGSDGEIYYGGCHSGACWYYIVATDWSTCSADVVRICNGNGGFCSSYQTSC